MKDWVAFTPLELIDIQRKSIADQIEEKKKELEQLKLQRAVVADRMTLMEKTFGFELL